MQKQHPINRSTCKWWRVQNPSANIEVKASKKFMTELYNSCRRVEECFIHKLEYVFYEESYRLYRRGKNRCNRCGCKIYRKEVQ